jgi:hypothetical protein
MSNRVRLRPATRRAILRAVRCPDCNSNVELHGGLLDVAHDDTCPRLAALRRRGRATQYLLVCPVDSWARSTTRPRGPTPPSPTP